MSLSEPAQVVGFVAPTLMTVSLFFHITGGLVGIVSGYTAIAAPKGAPVHRVAGTVFVIAMLTMAGVATAMAVVKGQTINIFAGLLTLYLVSTAWVVVKRPEGTVGRFEAVACAAGVGISILALTAGLRGGSDMAGVPNGIAFIFAGVTGIGVVSDVKVLVQRGVSGAGRISRHLWRISTALFVAAGSFFLGQMDTIPRELHGPHLYLAAFAPLALMVFWLVRVRFWKSSRAVPAPA